MFNHINWNRKYTTIAVYACISVFALVILLYALLNPSMLSSLLSKVNAILAPFFYGLVIAYLCNPIYVRLHRHAFSFVSKKKPRPRTRKALSIVGTYLIVILLISAFIMIMIPQIVNSYMDLEERITAYLASATVWIDNFVREFPLFNGQFDGISDFINTTDIAEHLKSMLTGSIDIWTTLSGAVINFLSRFLVEMKNLMIGLFISVYLLISKDTLLAQMRKTLRALFPRRRYHRIYHVASLTNKTFGRFIMGQIVDAAIVGLLTTVVLAIFQIPYYPLIGVIVSVTNVIPVFGPFIGAIPSAFIIFIADPMKALVFVVLIVIIQQIDGNIIAPKILGDSTGISAFWVIFSITLMGGLLGVLGMFIGVPVFAVLYALFKEYIERRLREKGLPVETQHYFHPSLNEEPEELTSADTASAEPSTEDAEADTAVQK